MTSSRGSNYHRPELTPVSKIIVDMTTFTRSPSTVINLTAYGGNSTSDKRSSCKSSAYTMQGYC